MVHFLIIMETLAVAALALFNGILNSKYYENLADKSFSGFLWYPVGLLVFSTIFTATHNFYGAELDWLGDAVIFFHAALHAVLASMLIVAVVRFADIPFKYARQYLLARASLYFSVVFEVVAMGVFVICCIKVF